jgi:glycosyltransferase involved in cell wall biosynthesis
MTERFPPDLGGVATSAGRITATLCQLGIAVDVVTWSRYLSPGEVLPPEVIPTQVGKLRLHRIGLYRAWDMTMPHTLNVLDWLHQAHSYDAVWGHYVFPSGFLATWWAEGQQLPSVVSARGNDIDRTLFPPGDFARLQWTLERASLVTTVSQDLNEKIQRLCRRDDTLLLPNVVDTQQFRPAVLEQEAIAALKATLGIIPEKIVLGFSGELREKKGQQFLLDALTTVRTQRPACLLIIGEVRPTEQAVLQTYAMQHPEAAQRIITTGHLSSPEAVAEHLQLCDLYLQPSLWEGMPNALLEAMACGLCCIASDVGGNAEVIEHGKNGVLLPRFQLHQLGAIALELLDQEPTVRQTIGQAARDRILSHYSLAQEKAKLQAICDRLISSSS